MSAAPRSIPLDALAHRSSPEAWVPIRVAARLMGEGGRPINHAVMRRRCEDWQRTMGMAEKRLDPETGHTCWHVHAALDDRLADHTAGRAPLRIVAAGEPTAEAALQREPRERVQLAERKALALKRFRQWREAPGVVVTRDYAKLQSELRERFNVAPSRSQIYAWHEAAPDSDDFAAVTLALLDTRGRPRGERVSDAAWAFFEELYLDWRRPSVKKCHTATRDEAKRRGWSWPSLRRVQQLVNERIPITKQTLHREGTEAYRTKFAESVEFDPDAWGPGERWEADHATADVFVQVMERGKLVARRPTITVWFDWRTRMVMGFCAQARAGDSDSVRAALLDALKREGVSPPRIAWLDNGKDFASEQFTGRTKAERRNEIEAEWSGLFGRLGIEAHFALPYNHNGKARIERFFGFLHRDYERELPSWCGSDAKDVESPRIRAMLKDPSKLPTLDEYRVGLATWIEHYNHRTDRNIEDLRDATGRTLAPVEMYAQRGEKRVLADASVLGLLEQHWQRPMTIGKFGIGLRRFGATTRYGKGHPILRERMGQRVFVTYDPDDDSAVRVYDLDFRFLCVAEQNERLGGPGATKDDVREAIRRRRAEERRLRQKPDTIALLGTDAERARAVCREREVAETQQRMFRETGERPAANLRLVQTGLEGEAAKVRRAEDRRLAAGGENDPDYPDDLDFTALRSPRRHEDDDDIDLGAIDAPEATRDDADDDDLESAFDDAFTTDETTCDGASDAPELHFDLYDDDAEDDVIDVLDELSPTA